MSDDWIPMRQILGTEIVVDKAEYEELRRNEAALKAAVKEWPADSWLMAASLHKHGAKL
jgi:hypothetical protein